MDWCHVIRVRVFLAEVLRDYFAFNEIYSSKMREYFPSGCVLPTRTTVGAALPLGALVEVEVEAIKTEP